MAEVTITANNSYGGGMARGAASWEALLALTEATAVATSDTTRNVKIDASGNEIYQLFFCFDTSTTNIPAGATINSVTLRLYTTEGTGWPTTAADICEVYVDDWTYNSIGVTDFISVSEAGSMNSAGDLVATNPAISNANMPLDVDMDSEAGFADALNTSGYTCLSLIPANWRTSTQTTANIKFGTQFHGTADLRPRLIVDYTEAASGRVLFPDFFGGLNCDMTGGI